MKDFERHKRAYRLFYAPTKLYLRSKMGYEGEPAPQVQGPYFVLSNHVTDADPFMLYMSFKNRHMYFLASEHVYRMGFRSRLIARYLAPIARVKGGTDLGAIKDMLKAIKKGHNIAFFPEGSRSFNGESAPVTVAAAKLIQKSGVPLITYHIQGGYLTTPRWAKYSRKGECRGSVVRVYQPDELAKMSPEELTEAISKDLYVDAYAEQKENPIVYHGVNLAEGLEEVLYICPKCGRIGTLTSRGNMFSCDCGLEVTLDETGFFQKGAPFESVLEWDRWQQEEILSKEQLSDPDFRLAVLDDESHATTTVAEGPICLSRESLSVGSKQIPLRAITGLAIIHHKGAESLMFTTDGIHYEITTTTRASRYKYFTLYQHFAQEL